LSPAWNRGHTVRVQVHLDTDIGGDPDDACALAMTLGWPGADLVGVTTNLDSGGLRAGCARVYLRLAGRADVPVAAGAGASLTTRARPRSTAEDARYWPVTPTVTPQAPGAALNLLASSIEDGAIIVAIGALTNLALLEITRPDTLAACRLVVMGGWFDPPADGLPPYRPEDDWNLQCDTMAAEIALSAAAEVTLVPLPTAEASHLRGNHLPRLGRCGQLGALLASQCAVWADDRDMAALGRNHPGLPDDLVNFHWDPVTCAVALGWPGARTEDRLVAMQINDGTLRWTRSPTGRHARVVTSIDPHDFDERFLAAVEALQR
jgi:inosine-uridine nucleoside N-ribohydrolase